MKKIIAVIMILALMLSCMPAFAASKTVYAGKKTVQVYAGKSTLATKIGKLAYGEAVTCTNYSQFSNGWAKIKNANGKIGFCKMNQLTDENPNNLDFKLPTRNKAIMYAKPSSTSKMITKFAADVKIRVVAVTPDCNWFRVKHDDDYGYISTDKMKGGTAGWFVGENNIVIVNGNGKKLKTLNFGEKVMFLDKTDGKILVRKGKIVGYCNCKVSDFVDEDPNANSETGYAAAKGARVYATAVATKSNAIATLDFLEEIEVLGKAEGVDFARVKYKDEYGYMLTNTILSEVPSGDVIVKAQEDELDIYKGKLYTTDVVATVDKGDEMILVEIKNARAKVTTSDGVTGWTLLSQLKLK